jgi:hypothetical protein
MDHGCRRPSVTEGEVENPNEVIYITCKYDLYLKKFVPHI